MITRGINDYQTSDYLVMALLYGLSIGWDKKTGKKQDLWEKLYQQWFNYFFFSLYPEVFVNGDYILFKFILLALETLPGTDESQSVFFNYL